MLYQELINQKKIRLNNISRKKFKPTNYCRDFSIIFKTCLHNTPTIIARTLKVKNATKITYGNCLGSFPENYGVKSTIGFSSTNETFNENLDETKLEIKNLKEYIKYLTDTYAKRKMTFKKNMKYQ